MWNRIEELESVIEDRPKIAQSGREIAKFFFLNAIVLFPGDNDGYSELGSG